MLWLERSALIQIEGMGAETKFSEEDLKAGRELVEKGAIRDLEFSEGTYQIEVVEKKSSSWVLLQLSDGGTIQSLLCNCASLEEGCRHGAAAYLTVAPPEREPLHVRFRSSLWDLLGKIGASRHGFDASALEKQKGGGYLAKSLSDKQLFELKPRTHVGKKKLEEIFTRLKGQSEENSIKFSNLSLEELELWREGRPSSQLLYELSFWSDLAKWWMLLWEKSGNCEIQFREGKEQHALPRWIDVRFAEVEFGFYLVETNWQELIPRLEGLPSPLKLHDAGLNYPDEIHYDPRQRRLLLQHRQEKQAEARPDLIPMGAWGYLPGEGFFSLKSDPLFSAPFLEGSDIEFFLTRYPKVAQERMRGGMVVDPTARELHYALQWKGEELLEIVAYLFDKEEGKSPHATFFGDWLFLPGKGFFKTFGKRFEELYLSIDRRKISKFLAEHRTWLEGIAGFGIQIAELKIPMGFSVAPDGSLRFFSAAEKAEERVIDLGEWVFLEGSGFYPASLYRQSRGAIAPETEVPFAEVNQFLHTNREELAGILGFFSDREAVERAGLSVTLDDANNIVVKPQYQLRPQLEEADLILYADFSYVRGEGFCQLGERARLPAQYTREKVIHKRLEPAFVSYELDLLRDKIITLDPRLRPPKHLLWRIAEIVPSSTQPGSWEIRLAVESEQGSVSGLEVWHALKEERGYLLSDAGLLSLKPGRFGWLRSLDKGQWSRKGLHVSSVELLYLLALEDVEGPEDDSVSSRSARKLLHNLKQLETAELLNLEGMRAELRSYQKKGVAWLWFLYSFGLSGLLCDEMGLGKTLQASALLLGVYRQQGPSGRPLLVVTPTSVLYHWEEILQRFFPDLPVRLYHGPQRHQQMIFGTKGILLTSYGTLRSDIEEFADILFEVAIFDEMHTGKNTHSQVHKALRRIQAKSKVGLTGTPIENRLLELKALFDIILPGFLPFREGFEEIFVKPIEREGSARRKEDLACYVRPFILRRRKGEVLSELPEKMEQLALCDLSSLQRELYQKALEKRSNWIQRLEEGHGDSYVHIFALISELKQICNHPAMILDKSGGEMRHYPSGKWDLFQELLTEVLESDQKVVIFSQYLRMLDYIGHLLKESGISYAEIRGSTKDRKGEAHRFRDDPHCRVFLGSLQAAGVGIDLTAASVVIHYDRWWNPAKENQATDRVHRMGQTRGVQVFKLVTRGTIEEEIDRLIRSKEKLLSDVVSYDDQDALKTLSKEQLVALLRTLPSKG